MRISPFPKSAPTSSSDMNVVNSRYRIFKNSFGSSTRQVTKTSALMSVITPELQAAFEVANCILYFYIQLWFWMTQLVRLGIIWSEHYVIPFMWSTVKVRARSAPVHCEKWKSKYPYFVNLTFVHEIMSNVKFPKARFHVLKGASVHFMTTSSFTSRIPGIFKPMPQDIFFGVSQINFISNSISLNSILICSLTLLNEIKSKFSKKLAVMGSNSYLDL